VAPRGATASQGHQRQRRRSGRHRSAEADRVRLHRLDRLRRFRTERVDRRPGRPVTVAGGTATKVPNTPAVIFGLAWKSKELYVSTGPTIVALSGWNGTTFSGEKPIYAGKEKGLPEVVEMSEKGQPRPFLTGFAASVIALGVNAGSIYVGDLTGSIYKVAAK
jgi:hypothetical protein